MAPAYTSEGCDCDFGELLYLPVQCKTCVFDANGRLLNGNNTASTQKRIFNQTGVTQSEYLITRSAWTSVGGRSNSVPRWGMLWNQMSDRKEPHIQTAYHPSRGNSTRSTLTSIKPGACAPAGKGVDIKHDSYARYLARKKAMALRIGSSANTPQFGNKVRPYNITVNAGAMMFQTNLDPKACFSCE
tara:strand:+ start:25 stop:585 length:561 start_codon:yes stop_codon:yes gene_type:complete